MKTIDARGLQCPGPIIATRRAMRESMHGEPFIVMIDSETSLHNVCKFLDDNGCSYIKKAADSYWLLEVSPGYITHADTYADINTNLEDYCRIPAAVNKKSGCVVVLSGDSMGSGDEELGKKLMASFVNILTELDHLPSTVVCYNMGVKLALPDSPVFETLSLLEKRGVEIILCGTCTEYYGINGKTMVGKTGDMYSIVTKMMDAQRLIKP